MADHAHDHGEYHHGKMDIHEQDTTYRSFLKVSKWFSLHLAVVLTFFIVWLCTPAGFLWSLIMAVVLAAAGTFLLGDWKKSSSH